MNLPRYRVAGAVLGTAVMFAVAAAQTARPPGNVPVANSATSLIDVQVAGHGEPQIIFIPGLACPGSVWEHVVARFEVKYRCHVVTLAGFGGKPPVECAHFLDDMADAIIAYVRAAKIERPVIVGHSLGGVLAMKIALRAPTLPARLVIVDSLPFLAALMAPHIDDAAAAQPLAERYRKLLAGQTPKEFAVGQREFVGDMITSPEKASEIAAATGQSDPATTGQAMGELIATDLRPELGQIKCPTLVLAALADKLAMGVPRAAVEATMHQQYAHLAGVRIQFFEQARHFIMIDDLDGFSDALAKELLRKD